MTLKHPAAQRRAADELAVAPLFSLETETIPRHELPESDGDLAAFRVVVRRGFTHDLAERLVKDIERQLPRLEGQPAPVHGERTASSFAYWVEQKGRTRCVAGSPTRDPQCCWRSCSSSRSTR